MAGNGEHIKHNLFGRRRIFASAPTITPENIVEVLRTALDVHHTNSTETNYLWWYYRGKQPVLEREKLIRPEITNYLVVNRAAEITDFKCGYLIGEPIQYVGRSGDDATAAAITRLNEMAVGLGKPALDKELVEWQMICGTAFRLVLPEKPEADDEDGAPFALYTLDPRYSFVVYDNTPAHKPVMGVTYVLDADREPVYSIYTRDRYYEVKRDEVEVNEPHALGMVPLIEYPANHARLGAFEIVLPLLDAINNLESNRMDGVEQQVQSFLKFINCDIDEAQFTAMKELGAIKVKSVDGQPADVEAVVVNIDQNQTQTLADNLYQTVLTICGIPNRNGGSSTSDTGSAVLLRDGWSLAEARAKDSELMFKRSETDMLRVVLRICKDIGDKPLKLRVKDVEIKFLRRLYENALVKSQILMSMLSSDKIHPLLPFQVCGLWSDPERAYTMSQQYHEEQVALQQEQMRQQSAAQAAGSDSNEPAQRSA